MKPGSEDSSAFETMVINPRNGRHVYTVVYLHPFSSGFEGYGKEDYALDYVRIVLPHAPFRPVTCYGGEVSAAWYDYLTNFGGEAEDELDLETLAWTRDQIFRLLKAELALLQRQQSESCMSEAAAQAWAREHLILGGCSQGCGAALDAALQFPEELAGFIGVAGQCLSSTPLGSHQDMPLHFFNKARDEVMRWDWVRTGMERLAAAGYQALRVHSPAPGGHGCSAKQEAQWIREAVGQIHDYHNPTVADLKAEASDKTVAFKDWFWRMDTLLRRRDCAAEAADALSSAIGSNAESFDQTSVEARLVEVVLPWTQRLAPKVPLVCAVVQDLLSQRETDALLEFVEREREGCWDFSVSLLKTAVDDCWGLTALLWSRLERFVPSIFRDKSAVGLNHHLRFRKFQRGHYFAPHDDSTTTHSREDGSYDRSFLSFVLYLSDPDAGGRTRFIAPNCPALAAGCRRCDALYCDACVDVPVVQGSAVLYAHLLTNADTEVFAGEKVVLRTDVMYR